MAAKMKKKEAVSALCCFYRKLLKAQPVKIVSVKFVSFPNFRGPRLYDEIFRGDSSMKDFVVMLARMHLRAVKRSSGKPIIRLVAKKEYLNG